MFFRCTNQFHNKTQGLCTRLKVIALFFLWRPLYLFSFNNVLWKKYVKVYLRHTEYLVRFRQGFHKLILRCIEGNLLLKSVVFGFQMYRLDMEMDYPIVVLNHENFSLKTRELCPINYYRSNAPLDIRPLLHHLEDCSRSLVMCRKNLRRIRVLLRLVL